MGTWSKVPASIEGGTTSQSKANFLQKSSFAENLMNILKNNKNGQIEE